MDNEEIRRVQMRLHTSAEKIKAMAIDAGNAKQAKSFTKRRLERLLVEFINVDEDMSDKRKEWKAMQDPEYKLRADEIESQAKDAEVTLAVEDAYRIKYETNRSLLAYERERLNSQPE